MKERIGVFVMILHIISFFIIPYVADFWFVSLLLTIIFSLLVVFLFDHWYKYFYPIFALSWFVIAMRICGAVEFLEIKELFLCFSGIGAAMGCIGLALKIACGK